MRKSMLDHRNRIAALLRRRDAGLDESDEGQPIEEAIGAQINLLWQTRALRRERLYVADEVDTVLTYFRDVFVPVIPVLYARWERVLGQRPASFLRLAVGSAAIATAIRMWWRTHCAWPWIARRSCSCWIISSSSIVSAPNSRSRTSLRRCRTTSWSWRGRAAI